jgi:hypothetical protein
MAKTSLKSSHRLIPAGLALAAAFAVFGFSSPAAAWWWQVSYDPQPCEPGTTTEVPELSGSGLGSAAVLIMGGLVLATGSRRRRSLAR